MTSDCLRAIADLSARSLHNVPTQSLVQTPPLPQCEVCIVVPVRNEAQMLESTLTALAHQIDLEGHPLDPARYEVILLANNCSDESATIAHRFAAYHPNLVLHVVERTLPAAKAHIGWVRKLLMDEAYNRLTTLGRYRGVIASTDGDTRVAPNWIAATLYEIISGADAVGGRIITDRRDRAALDPFTRACYLREVGYRFLVTELEAYLDPDPFDSLPRHFQHYGASLAVTAQMYQQAGGLPPVRTSEDVALYRALVRVNARFRHSSLVRVTTSARQIGRTEGGLANQLKTWAAMGHQQQLFLVEPAGAIVARLQARYELRMLWQRCLHRYQPAASKAIALLANRLGVDCDWLMHTLMQHTSFGGLFEQIEQQQAQEAIWQQRWLLVRIEQAIYDLRLLLEPLRRQQKYSQYQQQYLHKSNIHDMCLTLSHIQSIDEPKIIRKHRK
ncbi:MAG: glycosyltransferase family 2 protein [Chroococcidiopsidaceae cyanobacterium CP_BM_ER_R8_30]|nr:glycosyltransferase family 2 protein [Chroococcidiopsidaceae cyanobacterium CP_BM_ER_R8_30]